MTLLWYMSETQLCKLSTMTTVQSALCAMKLLPTCYTLIVPSIYISIQKVYVFILYCSVDLFHKLQMPPKNLVGSREQSTYFHTLRGTIKMTA